MKLSRKINILASLVLICTVSTLAQTPKTKSMKDKVIGLVKFAQAKVTIPVNHPAEVDIPLKRVMFKGKSGESVKELTQEVKQYFTGRKGISVMDRDNLPDILAEQDFTHSGNISKETILKVGGLTGATSIIILDVLDIRIDQKRNKIPDPKSGKSVSVLRTTAHVKVSVKAVDLETGEIMAAKTVMASKTGGNASQGANDFSPDGRLRMEAIRRAAEKISHHFLSWTENRDVVFFTDKKCNLQAAFHRLEADDWDEAWELMVEGLELAKTDPKIKAKTRARAHHNMAMLYFSKGEFDRAIELLREADKIKKSKIFRDAQALVKSARDMKRELAESDS